MSELDLNEIKERAEAASPGPWEAGDVWYVAGVIFDDERQRVGPGKKATRCAMCHLGAPVASGRWDINGTRMQAHRHHTDDPYAPEHRISSADGGVVAGNYDYEAGGILRPEDTAFIVAARQDVPALVAEVERLREQVTAMTVAASERRDYYTARCAQMEADHAETVAERDRAREIAVALEQENAHLTGRLAAVVNLEGRWDVLGDDDGPAMWVSLGTLLDLLRGW